MSSIEKLLDIMAALRDPQDGCPWDLQQDFSSIAPYTIEEAYEVADAIARGDLAALEDELGDLLFQVVFHARMAEEQGAFGFEDVARGIADKMLRRHPHVFGSAEERAAGPEKGAWERIKADERRTSGVTPGVLDGIPLALPALKRAQKLGKRAATVGFDWRDPAGVRNKVNEELDELDAARDAGDAAAVREELGDLLFSVANLARHLGVDPEDALAAANRKFEGRFRAMEAGEKGTLADLDEAALEARWQAAKGRREGR